MFQDFLGAIIPYGPWGLWGLSFAESSFFPLPPDVLLIALAIAEPSQAMSLALVTTAGSVCGAVFGYFVGHRYGRRILRRLVSPDKIAAIEGYYKRYDVWAVGIAGFTPIPYKVFTVSAGVFGLDLKRFILVSILSRGARFFLVAGIIYFFGEAIARVAGKYVNALSLVFVALLIGGVWAMKIAHKRARA
ncbi:MAG: YqaA family protein [Candidatus Omnitrophota bacterium]